MPKLWIAHPRPSVRAALARAAGVPAETIVQGEPRLAAFPSDTRPGALVLAFSDDLANELAFARAVRERAPGAPLVLICARERRQAIAGRFAGDSVAILDAPPDPRALRALLASALARGDAPAEGATTEGESTVARNRTRERAERRMRAWFGEEAITGFAAAFDPALRALPLLVRGLPGSGRALLVEAALRARGDAGPWLRIDAREIGDLADLTTRLRVERERASEPIRDVWIDEIDRLADPLQRRLADWIDDVARPHGAGGPDDAPLRWLATAGPDDLADRLAPELVRAFSPLIVAVPPLARSGDAIARIAEHVALEWSERSGAPPRRFRASALAALDELASLPGWLERTELESILRSSLAAGSAPELEARDLRAPGGAPLVPPLDTAGTTHRMGDASAARSTGVPEALTSDRPPDRPSNHGLSLDPDVDPSSALLALTEALRSEPERDRAPDPSWRRLARSLAHEIRNPLVSIRTFTELLPEHYADETFRMRFKELVGQDVAHIQRVVTQLAQAAERDRLELRPVDVSALIDRLLAARRDAIARRRLVVLAELERDQPRALADAEALELALGGLLDRALDALPDRGDLFLTTRRIAGHAGGQPAGLPAAAPQLRLLLRHHDPTSAGGAGELDPMSHVLEYVLAETIVAALGGRMTIDPTLGPQTVIVIDLPAP